MDSKTPINLYRARLDKTLACHDLTDQIALRKCVENRLLQSSECAAKGDFRDLVDKRTGELADFLSMLRSASVNDSDKTSRASGLSDPEWKVKQDNEECRIMYREGPAGTRLHVLLAEGYLDGPLDASLCVTWETTLYKKWWPQFNYPAFKVISSKCVRQIGIGEQISTVRFKVPWPLTDREALLHYYEYEFFQEDLVVVIIKTIDDIERDGNLYGISGLIPELKDAVRMGLVGGLVIQKVNNERSYFRLICSVDFKLHVVPPSLINFIARQLVGNGFKLCQKAVVSIVKGNKDFSKVLEGPMYTRIRQAVHLPESTKVLENKRQESTVEEVNLERNDRGHSAHNIKTGTMAAEVEEEGTLAERNKLMDDNAPESQTLSLEDAKNINGIVRKKTCPSPEVEHALGTLDRVIHAVKELHVDENVASNASKTGFEVAHQNGALM